MRVTGLPRAAPVGASPPARGAAGPRGPHQAWLAALPSLGGGCGPAGPSSRGRPTSARAAAGGSSLRNQRAATRCSGFFFSRGKQPYKDQRRHGQTRATTGGHLLRKATKNRRGQRGDKPGKPGTSVRGLSPARPGPPGRRPSTQAPPPPPLSRPATPHGKHKADPHDPASRPLPPPKPSRHQAGQHTPQGPHTVRPLTASHASKRKANPLDPTSRPSPPSPPQQAPSRTTRTARATHCPAPHGKPHKPTQGRPALLHAQPPLPPANTTQDSTHRKATHCPAPHGKPPKQAQANSTPTPSTRSPPAGGKADTGPGQHAPGGATPCHKLRPSPSRPAPPDSLLLRQARHRHGAVKAEAHTQAAILPNRAQAALQAPAP